MTQPDRQGVLAAGNFIIDHVKVIDAWPEQDTLASILSQNQSNGGGPYNLLKDLRQLGADFPLEAAGLVGDDGNGDWIIDDCEAHGIGTDGLKKRRGAATSYTDAMTVADSGRRTFFHHRGTNALLAEDDVPLTAPARIFYLGYFLLLDALDSLDAVGRTGASRLLEAAGSAGYLCCADAVSTPHPDFPVIMGASLPYLDVLFVNEIEAGMLLGIPAEDLVGRQALEDAGRRILDQGVDKAVLMHCARGAVAVTHEGCVSQAALELPAGNIVGTTGAGDAFAAGVVYGWHENRSWEQCLQIGVCAAAQSLSHAAPSAGLLPLDECLDLLEIYGCQKF